jgi:hypothetical protein
MVMPKEPKTQFNEKELTKGQIRKLNALRKSLGNDIADKAFAEWLATVEKEKKEAVDENAEVIAEAIVQLIKDKNIRFPRGGYLVTRWRDQVTVKPAAGET